MAGILRVSDPPFLGTRDLMPVDCLREGNEGKPKLRVLSEFRKKGGQPYRSSYRYRICYIYEIVKLNQIKLSNQFNYSEVKKDLKLHCNMI